MSRYISIILYAVSTIMLAGLFASACVANITFNIDVSDRLKRAADANTVELAKQELEAAIANIKSRQLTSGYTSVLYQTPDEDLGFWASNIQNSYNELSNLPEDSSPLERTNVLIKLRETLLDNGEHGSKVTIPDGASVYPHNKLYAMLFTVACLLLLLAYVISTANKNRRYKSYMK